MRRTTIAAALAGALLLPLGSPAQEIRIEVDDDWAEDFGHRMEILAHRLSRMGERVARIVDRAVMRSVDRIEVRMDDEWWDDDDFDRHFDFDYDFDFDDHFDHDIELDLDDSYKDEGFVEATSFQEGDFSWEGELQDGDVLEIKGVNGPVYAEPADGDRVEVVAEKWGDRSDPDDVRIDVVEHGGGVTICAVYPSRGRRENRCRPGDGGRLSSHRNDVKVRFKVKVPAGIHFVGKTVNGDVEALGLHSDAEVSSVNGDVEVSTTGAARATTVNGSIRATMGRLGASGDAGDGDVRISWADELEFSTVNGSITLDLPDDVNAEIDAKWVNGSLDSDLPLTVQRMGRREAHGTLGSGGPRLRLSTVNGSIRLR